MFKKSILLKLLTYFFFFLFILATIGIIAESTIVYKNDLIKIELLIFHIFLTFFIWIMIILVVFFKKRAYKKIKLHFIVDPKFHSDFCKKTTNKNNVKIFYFWIAFLTIITAGLIYLWIKLYDDNAFYFSISLLLSHYIFWIFIGFLNFNFCNNIKNN
ncbi:hypothetical protein [Mesomycoplasma neurolyticum]|uniref:Uncharacterized protein n=1 Tax=Mesomycoplasma neurolyticum TaxID=2120 RepID=A0A449A6J8_9BACT|nr:hypothetical protein [Mesomycoplasma neurolyticum]VEU59783.1 Uncharacterised protein [Mesomycoplasma neurolyticum]